MSDCRLILGDALAVLPTLGAGSFDAVICDPPYATTQCRWDSLIPLDAMWREVWRVLRPRGVVALTASQPFTSRLVMSNPEWFRHEWVWDKANPSGHLNAKRRPLLRHESILVFAEGRHTYNPQMRTGRLRTKGSRSQASDCYGEQRGSVTFSDRYYPTSILTFSNAHKAARVHPTQKPVALMEYLVRTYTNEGETVLDFAAGSGTTGIACLNTGRRFIGIEKDAGYFAVAEKRLAEARAAAPLFAGAV